MQRGLFLVFEGNNGAGKTTIINKLLDKLQSEPYVIDIINERQINKWNIYKFPNRNTILGKKIDDFLKNKINLTKDVELKFFADNRKEFQAEMLYILNRGYNIICDRYVYSSMAYTLTSQSVDIINKKDTQILSMDQIIKYDYNCIRPDYVFIICGDFLHLRNENKEKYHKNKLFNSILLNNYILSIQRYSTNFAIIDNIYGKLDETIEIIIKIINDIKNK
jgi:dTMP kinase